jgi:hypothetical protein
VVTGLTKGTSYTFTVTATNRAGTSSASAASAAIIPAAVPAAPTTVTVTTSDSSATISWVAPTVTGGSALTGYVVYRDGQAVSCAVGLGRTCSITGLTNGTAYQFSVGATNKAGTGPTGAATTLSTPSTLPSAPQIDSAVFGNGQVTIGWSSNGDGGAKITAFSVAAFDAGVAVTGKTCATARGTDGKIATSCTVSRLTNGTAYTFKVTATNLRGTSSASTASDEVVPATAPDSPTGVTATSNANGSSVVTWVAPLNSIGRPVLRY